MPPSATIFRKTSNVDSRNTSRRSWIGIPQRRSGLSDPYFAIASEYAMRGNGVSIVRPTTAKMSTISGSMIPKIVSGRANDISTSTCVNSGCRSARRSSSRKHLQICT